MERVQLSRDISRKAAALLGAAALLVFTTAPARAQILIVTVADAISSKPIKGAEVRVLDEADSVIAQGRAGGAGEVRLALIAKADSIKRTATLTVRALGFSPASQRLELDGSDRVKLQVALSPAATVLSEVRITERRSLTPWLKEFEERRSRLNGFFMDREEIDRRGDTRLSDLLRAAPGLTIIPYEGRYIVASERAAPRLDGGACHISYYMDGTPMPLDSLAGIDVALSVNEIEAVEVYTGGSRVPARFNQSNARCGVIAFWSRAAKTRD